jgi:hypothetical protein
MTSDAQLSLRGWRLSGWRSVPCEGQTLETSRRQRRRLGLASKSQRCVVGGPKSLKGGHQIQFALIKLSGSVRCRVKRAMTARGPEADHWTLLRCRHHRQLANDAPVPLGGCNDVRVDEARGPEMAHTTRTARSCMRIEQRRRRACGALRRGVLRPASRSTARGILLRPPHSG